MKKFNKTLLALAVAGAMILPGLSAAADLSYSANKQITFAKDLIVNNSTTINTPNSLNLTAESTDIIGQFDTIAAGSIVTVKVTLTDLAKFDSNAAAPALVAGFAVGAQLGGGALVLSGTPYYSASGQELNFSFIANAQGQLGAPGDVALTLNSLQITNLLDGLYTGSKVGAQITMQNNLGQQVLAAKSDIALSQWGLVVTSDTTLGDTAKTIDVGASPRKTLFSPGGTVGGSMSGGAPAPGSEYFNAGKFTLDISKHTTTGGGAATYVNNFNAIAANPNYNVVATADINVTVTGSDLTAFTGGSVWLDQSPICAHTGAGTFTNGAVAGGVATFNSPANVGIWANVTAAAPSPADAYVCFASDNATEMQAQLLSGTVDVAYNLVTQRRNPPQMAFDLLPLRLNGTNLVFQNVNPAASPTAQSFIRLTNNNAQVCPVTIDAKDDAGLHSGDVSVTLAPHGSMQLNSDTLEGLTPKSGVTGAFGDGTGKWYVRVTAECTNFKASALNRNSQSGTVTDLTPEKGSGGIEWLTPPNSL